MEYRYSAYVTFPLAAKEIKDVAAWLSENVWAEVNEAGAICQVSDVDASYGEIDITKVLDAHQVPYDHHHRDDDAMDETTIYMRYMNGDLHRYRRSAMQDERCILLQKILTLLVSGDVTQAMETCRSEIGPEIAQIDEIAKDWVPTRQSA